MKCNFCIYYLALHFTGCERSYCSICRCRNKLPDLFRPAVPGGKYTSHICAASFISAYKSLLVEVDCSCKTFIARLLADGDKQTIDGEFVDNICFYILDLERFQTRIALETNDGAFQNKLHIFFLQKLINHPRFPAELIPSVD